ncbi:hypothetical protein KIN20_001697 [Parelaphostrongylus tenuis]|uniref:7TM GPCR serpentine receptor class x (Srx) domain-containing protein n=1 Tax=Parelaphostrongylus tenuis TaxID=148309 RepID=A0AAD5QH83_PARTN|nr:hypothetical protein KIN20_001697 [Parelaphostrongylus tenuis]
MYDMVALAITSLLTGYFWIVGGNYCHYPNLIFITGAVAGALWCGSCMNCFVLVINRLLDVSNSKVVEMMFDGNRTYLVLLIPFAYFLCFALFTPPVLFNSDHMAWYFVTFAPNADTEGVRGMVIALENVLGSPAFVYLFLNKTIQREVFGMLRNRKTSRTSVAPKTGYTSTKGPRTEAYQRTCEA